MESGGWSGTGGRLAGHMGGGEETGRGGDPIRASGPDAVDRVVGVTELLRAAGAGRGVVVWVPRQGVLLVAVVAGREAMRVGGVNLSTSISV